MHENHYLSKVAADYSALASATATAAITAAPNHQPVVLTAAENLAKIAARIERKAQASESAIAVLPDNATVAEMRKSRRRQATRRGELFYLPSWSAMAQALPNAFLRSALFSVSSSVQSDSCKVMASDPSILVVDEPIFSYDTVTLTLSGYKLCQFDRLVYSTCLDYYRDIPLSGEDSTEYVPTSFYEFSTRLGHAYGLNTHRAIRASLLRLSFAQIRLHYESWNLEIPKLLTVSFEDGKSSGAYRGSDILLFRVSSSVAGLFGPKSWTAVDKEAVGFDGLLGWLASFYAGHSTAKWLAVEWLHHMSGYESHLRNFKSSLVKALEKMKGERAPECCRVTHYQFTADGTRLLVMRPGWILPE